MGRHRLVLSVLPLALTYLAVAMNLTVANVVLPVLSSDFEATSAQLAWVVNITPIVAAALILFAGAWGDRVGPRRLLIIGVLVFLAAATLSGFAESINQLILLRGLTGVGSALAMPAALALTFSLTHGSAQRTAIGIMASTQAVGAMLGPIVGGAALTAFSWPAAFWSVVPMLIIALVGILALLAAPTSNAGAVARETSATSGKRPLDTIGAALAALTATGLLFALVTLGSEDLWNVGVVVGAGIGVAALVGLIFWERHTRFPLFIGSIMRRRSFWLPTLAIFGVQLTLGGMLYLVQQYLQLVLDYTAFEAGALMLPGLLMWAVAAAAAGMLAKRWGVPHPTAVSLLIGAVGLLFLTRAGESPSLAALVVALLLTGAMGVTPALMTHTAVHNFPDSLRSTGSAINGVATRLGLAFGVALYGTLLARIYRHELSPALSQLPETEAESAGQSLGAALRTAAELDPASAAALSQAARESFLVGFDVSLTVAASIAIALGVAVWTLLGHQSAGEHKLADVQSPHSH